jgi:hypothetical protein
LRGRRIQRIPEHGPRPARAGPRRLGPAGVDWDARDTQRPAGAARDRERRASRTRRRTTCPSP